MELFPAIDLCGGKAVRLLRGDYDKMTVYSDSPIDTARSFKQAGAEFLHLVDLDGARSGGTPNFDTIRDIVTSCGLKVEIGGGIRDILTVEKYIQMGVIRVILGTAAVTDPDFLEQAVSRFGDKIAVGADLKDGFVATHGWTQKSEVSGFDFCERLQSIGVKTLICTDISKDGAMQGVNSWLYRDLKSRINLDIIASGGVTTVEDLLTLSEIGVAGAILGKSIYTGGIDLKSAIEAVKKAENR